MLAAATFAPGRYVNARGRDAYPFGLFTAVAYDFLSGFKSNGDTEVAFLQDMAVVTLNDSVSARAGTLGLGFRPEGYTGRVYTAGACLRGCVLMHVVCFLRASAHARSVYWGCCCSSAWLSHLLRK